MERMKTTTRPRGRRRPSIPGFAAGDTELSSFAYVSRSLGFWARQMSRIACDSCGVVGSVRVDVRNYAVRFDCDHCAFEHFELFEGKGFPPKH